MATANPLRVELGHRLRAFRERTGAPASAIDGDSDLGWYPGKTSKVETGTRVPVTAEVNRLADLYHLTDGERADLHALATAARKRSRVPHVADFARSYVLLEQAAERIDYHDAELVPALLQTPGYARDLLSQSNPAGLDERVAERLSRSELLRSEDAPRLRVILGEAALHRMPVDRSAAREQLEHLRAANDMPTVELRILPFEVGLHSVIGLGFIVLRLANPAITRVYLEGATAATYLHESDETDVYRTRFDRLWTHHAVDASQSAILLDRHIQQLG